MDAHTLLDDAIFYAGQMVAERGQRDGVEYITAVYQRPDGLFGIASPGGGKSHREVSTKLTYPRDAVLKALVHNHPELQGRKFERDRNAHEFSPEDLQQAKELGIPSYITFGQDMRMSSFTPGVDSERLRRGKEFRHIPEVTPAGEYLGIKRLVSDAK